MTDWRTDKDLLADLGRRIAPTAQQLWRQDIEAARADDVANKRGHLILNPDLDTGHLDIGGCIVVRPGEGEGGEYRVIIDQALKGMKDPKTGEIRAGYWLRFQEPLQILPMVPFMKGVHDITARVHEQHSKMAKVAPKLEPMSYPTTTVFDFDDAAPVETIDEMVDNVITEAFVGIEEKVKRGYEAWLDYYRKAENLDRIHPHLPARRGFREVTTQGVRKSPGYSKALKQLSIERNILMEGIDRQIQKQCQEAASKDFDAELEPCECDACRRFRNEG